MPYSKDNPPAIIKDLPAPAQAMFIAAFNSANDAGKSEEDCMKIGWTAVKTKYMQDKDGKWVAKPASAASVQHGEIIALASSAPLGDGKTRTIQVLRTGEFTDMHGTAVPIVSADLDAYITHSNARLASDELPIELGHPDDPGAPAAAWYRKFFKQVIGGVEWVCAEIELSALGAQSLTDKLYKYFSANLDLTEKVICGGGFVNRPAVRGQQAIGSLAQYLQPKADSKPSAFAAAANLLKRALGIAQLEMSQEDVGCKIDEALRDKYRDPMMGDRPISMPFPSRVKTYADYVIVCMDGDFFKLGFTVDASGDVALDDPIAVEIAWTPKGAANEPPAAPDAAAMSNQPATNLTNTPTPTLIVSTPAPALAASTASASSGIIPTPKGGETNMGNENQIPTPVVTVPAVNPLPVTVPDPTLPVEEQIRLAREEATLAARTQVQSFEAQLAAARKDAWEKAQSEMTRKQSVASLAQKLTGGMRQLPFKTNELEDALAKLSDVDREVMAPLLNKIQDSGLVDLGEIGTSQPGQGFKELAAFAKPLLKEWLAKGDTAENFFLANPELGKVNEYNLSEFVK